MKKSLIITLSLVTLLFGQYCSAQIKTTDSSTIKFWDIKRFILNDYKVEQGFIDTACISSIVLVKFKIINSRIDSIEFTKSTPQPIRLALKKALRVDKGGLTLHAITGDLSTRLKERSRAKDLVAVIDAAGKGGPHA